jgi:hypothetical protein
VSDEGGESPPPSKAEVAVSRLAVQLEGKFGENAELKGRISALEARLTQQRAIREAAVKELGLVKEVGGL